ncbi:MAG: diacylglycerol kinase [Treponema sp.]|jgi:diacylglycerol kinase family enzyme|nr:diacylglycerol kinase [Treponema sp.]
MDLSTNLAVFAASLAEICSHTALAPERPLTWTVIANPHAGGFTIGSRWKRHEAQLTACVAKAQARPRRDNAGPSHTALEIDGGQSRLGIRGLILTNGPGHARKLTEALINEARSITPPPDFPVPHSIGYSTSSHHQTLRFTLLNPQLPLHLIITAGGDGTSLEVLTVLADAAPTLRARFVILRLPMGTGNDGADAWELDTALNLLLDPTTIAYTSALRLTTSTPGKGPFMAFNILSVGLDAFVTHMTNKMKRNLPGDSYKLWVDIAAILYDRLFKVGQMEVRALDERGVELTSFKETVLLMAVGVSGHRSYGSHKRILPDDRNVCVVKQMSLGRKIALKGLFTTGTHIDKPESFLFNANRVAFRGQHPILAQMDGETVLLGPADFPAVIELTEPVIPILKPQSLR